MSPPMTEQHHTQQQPTSMMHQILINTFPSQDSTPRNEHDDPFATPVLSRSPSPLSSTRNSSSNSLPRLCATAAAASRAFTTRQRPDDGTRADILPTNHALSGSQTSSAQLEDARSGSHPNHAHQDILSRDDFPHRPLVSESRSPSITTFAGSLQEQPNPLSIDDAVCSAPEWNRGPRFWRTFTALCVPLLLSALEGSITNTALPTISEALDLGPLFSWVATAFLLASTIFQPLYGQIGDILGRKYPIIFAVAIFFIGSLVCALAHNGGTLITGRIIQGLGTGGIDLFAELILSDLVPLRQRGTYMSIKHCVFAIGTTVGPLLGGVFAEKGWRWCFWINLPVCGVAIMMLWAWLHVDGSINLKEVNLREELRKVDLCGTSLLTSAVILILVSLSMGGTILPWAHPAILIPMVIGLILLSIFPIWERSARCKYPTMPPFIFSNRTSAIAFVLTAIHGFVTYGIQFYLPPFFQAVKESSPTESGVQILPTTLVIVIMAAIGGPVLSYFGKYRPIHQIGYASMTLGYGLCTTFSSTTPTVAWVCFQLLVAFGSGIIVSTMLPAVLVELPDSSNAAAAGAWAFLRGTGSLFGVAVPGAIFNAIFSNMLPSISSADARSQLRDGQAYQRASSKFVSKFGPAIKGEIIQAFSKSLECVWIVFAVLAGIGFLLTWSERQVKMRQNLDTKYGLKAIKTAGENGGTSTPEMTVSADIEAQGQHGMDGKEVH